MEDRRSIGVRLATVWLVRASSEVQWETTHYARERAARAVGRSHVLRLHSEALSAEAERLRLEAKMLRRPAARDD